MGTSRTVAHYASGDNRDYEFEWGKVVLEYPGKGISGRRKELRAGGREHDLQGSKKRYCNRIL